MTTQQNIDTELTRMLGIQYPIIMAPMFLVSNEDMIIAAYKAGITGCIPALNYRDDESFRKALDRIVQAGTLVYGINLIANKSNIRLDEQLKTCIEYKVPFIITSLGSPEKIIQSCKPLGIRVFCDVVDDVYAAKVESLGADAVIAVNSGAGGHAGPMPAEQLIPLLINKCKIPVISAGGIGNGIHLHQILSWGACGASVGSMFIASNEAPVSNDYKQAIVNYGAKDIVLTTRLSGTPCTIINTPYVQQTGTQQSRFERFLNKNKRLKKWAKMLTFYKGMKMLEKSAFGASYKTMWCAGPSIEYVKNIRPVADIVSTIIDEYHAASAKH